MTNKADGILDDIKVPEGWSKEQISSGLCRFVLIKSRHGYMATLDLEQRGFRSGMVMTGKMTSAVRLRRTRLAHQAHRGGGGAPSRHRRPALQEVYVMTMSPKTKALLDLEILLGTASAASMQANETDAQWKETLVALRDKIDQKIKDLHVEDGS